MKFNKTLLIFLTFLACSCAEMKENEYANYDEVRKAELNGPVWLPDFLPADATEIVERHDIDSNQMAVSFKSGNDSFVAGMREVPQPFKNEAKKYISDVNFGGRAPQDSGVYHIHCSAGVIGILTRDKVDARFYYFESRIKSKLSDLCG